MPLSIRHSSSFINADDFLFIKEIVRSNFVGEGPFSHTLALRLKEFSDRKYALLTTSGTSAVEIVLTSLKRLYPRKNQVLVGAYICPSVVSAIQKCDLKPIFVDTLPQSLNISILDTEKKISAKTLVCILSNMGGVPDDFNRLEKTGIPIISDVAQGVGSRINDVGLSSLGIASIFSFGPTKMITGGLGGAILTNNKKLFDLSFRLASKEFSETEYKKAGFVSTHGQYFSDLNAGLVLSQLNKIDEFILLRRRIASQYDSILKYKKSIKIVSEERGQYFNRFRYYFLTNNAAKLIANFHKHSIDARKSISHDVGSYFKIVDLPNLKRLRNKVVSLPIYPSLTSSALKKITTLLEKIEDK